MQIHIPKNEPRTRHAQTSVTEAQFQRLRALAQEHDVPVAAVLFHFIKRCLDGDTKDVATAH